jgi:hypothetical protein
LSHCKGIFVYSKHKQTIVAVVYVDDAFFCGSKNSPLVNKLKDTFMAKWECRELNGKEFLRMRITWKGQSVYLDQQSYLEKVFKQCNMENACSAPTPLPEGYIPLPNKNAVDPALRSRFQTVIGSLLYLMIGTRPDIAFAVTALSRHSANPSQDHLNKAFYICHYLVGTKDYSLKYNGQIQGNGVIACTDSDWAANLIDRRSITGHFVKLAGGAILWLSQAQSTVALSSTEAKYMGLADCARQILWIRSLLAKLGLKPGKLPICADNQGSIFIASNAVTEQIQAY